MIDGKFDVVFRGKIVRGLDESVVKSNLVTLFKSSPEAVDKLFNGSEVVVRKELDYATAMKYQSALKKAGIEIPFPQRDIHIRSGGPLADQN